MNILLVEDEDNIASFMAKGLTAEGHHVERAATAADGAALAVTYDFDVILLDLMLPDAHGRDALERIRQVKPDTPVIVVSALGEIEDKVSLPRSCPTTTWSSRSLSLSSRRAYERRAGRARLRAGYSPWAT